MPSAARTAQAQLRHRAKYVRPHGSLTLTLSLSEFAPDLPSPWHAIGPESLSGLVNQS